MRTLQSELCLDAMLWFLVPLFVFLAWGNFRGRYYVSIPFMYYKFSSFSLDVCTMQLENQSDLPV